MKRSVRFRLLMMIIGAMITAESHALVAQTFFFANLTGAQEVPAVNTPALGTAWAILSADRTRLTYQITFARLQGNYTVSHIHQGAAGANGGVIHGFTVSTTANNTLRNTWTGITSAQADALLAGNMYFNVHSSIAPGGEIRGQILQVTTNAVPYMMDIATDQVPLSIASGRGTGFFVLNGTVATYSMTVAGMPVPITVSHFHRGRRGVNGPVAQGVTFTDSTLNGTWAMAQSDIDTLRAGGIYMNIHTQRNPAGEIRGQVESLATVFATSVRNFPADILGSVGIAPNPAVEQALLTIHLQKPTLMTIELVNLLGQSVQTIARPTMMNGVCSFALETSGIMPGMYFVRMRSDAMMKSMPLVIQK